jgi:hypothetical protein
MQLITINAQEMRVVLKQSNQERLTAALRTQTLDKISLDQPNIPTILRLVLRGSNREQLVGNRPLTPLIYFLLIMIFTALYYQSLEWIVVGVLCFPMLLLAGYAVYIRSPDWASKQLAQFLDVPFLFIFKDTIYENLPQLRRLSDEITNLESRKNEAQHAHQQIDQLIRSMKEKLILLGETTSDPVILKMEVEKITQEKIISKAAELITIIKERYQEQLKTRQELLHRLELHAMRQQASSITGKTEGTNALSQLTELEMQSLEMSLELNAMQAELTNINLRWKSFSS